MQRIHKNDSVRTSQITFRPRGQKHARHKTVGTVRFHYNSLCMLQHARVKHALSKNAQAGHLQGRVSMLVKCLRHMKITDRWRRDLLG